jgi:hypothetical protein
MTADEKDIIQYLKGWPHSFVSAREIARKVGSRKRYEENRGWALPILVHMVCTNLLETDHLGAYRLRVEDVKKKRRQTHVSPQLLKILKSAGKSFDGFVIDEDGDDLPVLKYRLPAKPPAANQG